MRAVERYLSDDGDAIEVLWSDGHFSSYPLRLLRGYCPCAECQGHGGGPLRFVDHPEVELQGVRLVGNYGFTPVFSDGHQTGIFADAILRGMCPCPECLDLKSYGPPLTPLTFG